MYKYCQYEYVLNYAYQPRIGKAGLKRVAKETIV